MTETLRLNTWQLDSKRIISKLGLLDDLDKQRIGVLIKVPCTTKSPRNYTYEMKVAYSTVGSAHKSQPRGCGFESSYQLKKKELYTRNFPSCTPEDCRWFILKGLMWASCLC